MDICSRAKAIRALRAAAKALIAADDLQRPALQQILMALKRQAMDSRTLKKATGMHLAEIKTYLTRLTFLGAIASQGGQYVLTDKGRKAVS